MQGIRHAKWTCNVAAFMAAIMLLLGFVPRVEAGFVSSTEAIQSVSRVDDMATVQRTLENKMVVKRLEAMGYSPQEIQARVKQISDEELHQLASNMNGLDAASGALGVVIAVLVIILLVLLILKLDNKTVEVN